MRARMVVLPSVEEQRAASDVSVIDPAIVKLGDDPITIFRNFNYRVPEDVVGTATNLRLEDGRIVADVDFLEIPPIDKITLGVSGIIPEGGSVLKDDGRREIRTFDLIAIGATWRHGPAKPRA